MFCTLYIVHCTLYQYVGHSHMHVYGRAEEVDGVQVREQCELLPDERRYCKGCVCSVPLCYSPRDHADMCYKHRNLSRQMGSSLSCALGARSVLGDMRPSDITALLCAWPIVGKSTLLTTVVSLLKEPTAIQYFVESLGSGSATCEKLGKALQTTCARMSGNVVRAEHDNLGRQGFAQR